PGTLDNFKELFLALNNGSEYMQFSSEIVDTTGKTWYFLNYVSVASLDHDLSRVYISYLDITKQKKDHLQVLKTNKELIDVSEEIIASDREIKEFIKKQQASLKKNRAIHSLFSDILQATNLPIIIWDSSMTIVWTSVALQYLCGYQEIPIIGKPIWILFPKSIQTHQMELISHAPAQEKAELVITLMDTSGRDKKILWKCINKIAMPDSTEISGAILKEVS
ncbi:MAG TPA: PAS domain-containing protein, partial [Methanospirillum sp.]|uniref:PAS domain-containing protein n=1 Tax=Methanospirillum sp. TaxID=45200 RepID=UPI002C937794